jgi:hypothetical protein
VLHVHPPLDAPARIALGRDLAHYLDEPDLHALVSLFLTNPEAHVQSENITPDDIAEAGRRVERHRRRSDDGFGDEQLSDELDDLPLPGVRGGESQPDDGPAPEPASPPDDASEGAVAPPGVSEPAQMPDIDPDTVVAIDVVGGTPLSTPSHSRREGRGEGGGGGGARTDWARLEAERRMYGLRGEHAAFEQERRRVAARRLDPELVRWVARGNERSPYDIESIDEDGGPRYIEVKATSSDDPAGPFLITDAELRFAMRNRARYSIHRVTNVRSSGPMIFRYDDPFGELEAGRGYMRATQAAMALPAPR